MKHLTLAITLSWLIVFCYALFCISANLYSWGWLILLVLSFFYLIGVCIISGVVGFLQYNTLFKPALINGVCGLLSSTLLMLVNGALPNPLIGVGAFLITLISALIAYIFKGKSPVSKVENPDVLVEDGTNSSQPIPVQVSTLPTIPPLLRYFLIGVIIILFNVLAIWCSWHDFIIERNIFWKEITAHVSHLTPEHFSEREGHPKNLLFDESGNLFTGVVEAYKPRLRINPFPPVPKGVEYYVNGKCWGISNEDYRVVHPLRMYMSDIVPRDSKTYYFVYEEYIKNIRNKIQEECDRYLIHKDYIENVSTLLDEYTDGYVILPGKNSSVYLLGVGSGMLRQLTVSYYEENGLVEKIEDLVELPFDSEEGWNRYDGYSYFDRLGKMTDGSEWKRDDFVFVDSFPDPVMAGMATINQKNILKEHLISSARFCYGDKTYRWDENLGVLENLYKFYHKENESIPGSIIHTRITGGESIEGDDRELLLNILSRCNHFTIEDDFCIFLREPEVSYLVVYLRDAANDIPLYYVDGRFLLRHSFYSFPIDNPADRKQIEKLIEKYKS